MKVTNLKLTLRNDPNKIESDLKTKKVDLRASLAKKISELETLKEYHKELYKFNKIVKGELTQCKKQLENIFSSREKLDGSMSIHRPFYEKITLGYLINISTKKLEVRTDPKAKDKSDDKIESNEFSKKPKEVEQIN